MKKITAAGRAAFAWWDTLRNTHLMSQTKDKGYYADKYFGFNMRMWKWLSEDEIIMIWASEHCLHDGVLLYGHCVICNPDLQHAYSLRDIFGMWKNKKMNLDEIRKQQWDRKNNKDTDG